MFVKPLDTVEELERVSHRQPQRIRRRFRAVILAREGASAAQIAFKIGCSPRMVQLWVKCYNTSGSEGLRQWWVPRAVPAQGPAVETGVPNISVA